MSDTEDAQQRPAASSITRSQFIRMGAGAAGLYAFSGLISACGGSSSGSSTSPTGTAPAGGAPAKGGTLKVGVAGGGQETLYPFNIPTVMDLAQTNILYDHLTRFVSDGKTTKVEMAMAESVEPSAGGKVWTVTLRDGLLCHDGKPFTSADVVFSFAQLLDPKSKSSAGGFFPGLKPHAVKALDPKTVRFTFEHATAEMPTRLALTTVHMIRKDHTDFVHPIGTGPFKLASFKPGEQTVFTRFDGYWQENRPYLDGLELYTLNEPAQRMNALRAGQVDAIAGVDPKQVRSLESQGLKLLTIPGGRWFPIVMKKGSAPFDDVRVRQAFRLMMDRKQFVENVYEGQGIAGSDLFSPFDPAFASDLVREQDLEQAKSLLKQAGRSDLSVTLPVADYDPQIVPMGTLLAASAQKIGVTVRLQRANAATYFDAVWGKKPMFTSEWSGYPLLIQMLYCIGKNASENETDETGAKITALVAEASRTIDDAKRADVLHEAQKYLFDEGGYLIPGFSNNIDAHTSKVGGLVKSPYGNFGLFDFSGAHITS